MITLYRKSSGQPVNVIHAVDAKEYLAGGAYVLNDPTKKPELPAKSEAKPAVIPTAEDKKPVPTPVVKEEPVVKSKFAKPARKNIVKRPSKITK